MAGEAEKLENEAEIVEKAKTDEASFEILYNFYFPKIYGYIYKRVGNREICEDVLSITFMRVFTNLKKYESRGYSFGSWLYRIATNNLMDYYRQHKIAELTLEDNDVKELDENGPVAAIEKKQNLVAIEKTLSKLPERYREIINLRYFGELEIDEIADVLKISKVNASVIIHRALKCFKDKYIE